jgi:hypothetical protein
LALLLTLKRLKDEDKTATTGDLWTEDDKHWFTLEPAPPVIPTGIYEVRITPSPKFKRRLPLLIDVPGHDGIRIHPGNFPRDTEGCILLGRVLMGDSVLESDPAFEDFFRWLDAITEPVYIDIGWTA